MRLEIPGYDEGPKYREILRCDDLSAREAKAKPARAMELQLQHRFRMRSRISGFSGFKDHQNSERGMVLALTSLASTRSIFEATAEDWRFEDEACHAYSSKVSRPCNPTAP